MTILSITPATTSMEQPGRLFHKTSNLDAFFQDHRQENHQTTGNDHDGFLPIHSPPSNKSSGGAALGSPVSVHDVKHFEPLDYQDDGGGVSIDLCLPENNNQNKIDDLLQEQEQCCQRLRSPSSFLAPIFEERRVTFAAEHMVLKVNDTDNCAIDQRFVHQVFDAVQVWFIPHHTEYDEQDRNNLWYTQNEMCAMKENAIEAKRSRRRERVKAIKAQQFEAELDTCSLFPSLFAHGVWEQKLHAAESGEGSSDVDAFNPNCRRCRYEETVIAVLQEQYEQRMMCLRVYGRVDHGYSGIIDSDRLAQVYSIVGDTQRCHERAVAKAKKSRLQDEHGDSVEEEDSKNSSLDDTDHNHEDQEDVANSSGYSTSTSNPTRPSIKRSSSFKISTISFETSNCLNKSVSSLFQVLLTPFLEMRKEDLFLGIGEEMSMMA